MDGQKEYIEPLEAAIKAGAAHIWKTNYEAGAYAGWAAGWAAGWTFENSLMDQDDNAKDIQADLLLDDRHKNEASGITSKDKPSPVTELQMTAEWAELFARGEKNRKRRRTQVSTEEESETKLKHMDLGGKAFEHRLNCAEVLYGDATQQLLQLEAEMDAQYQRVVSRSGAQLWPIV